MNPYEVLGVARGETDPAVIRRAYAEQVRLHRPDEDPEGFRRVRAAYEMLLAWSRREEGGGQTGEDEGEQAREGPAPLTERRLRGASGDAGARADVPDPASPDHPALEELRAASQIPSPAHRREALRQAAAHLGEAMRADPRFVPAWSEALVGEFGREPGVLAEVAGDADLVAELETGGSAVTRIVLEHLVGTNELARLESFGRAVLDSHAPALEGHAAGGLHFALAQALAIVSVGLARELVDRAVEIVPGLARMDAADGSLDRLDELLVAGSEVAGWKRDQRCAAARMVARGKAGRALDRAEAIVLDMARTLARDSVVRGLLLGYSTAPAPVPSTRRRRTGRPAAVALPVFAVLVLVGLIGRLADHAPHSRFDRTDIRRSIDDARRAIDDARRLQTELDQLRGKADTEPGEAPTPASAPDESGVPDVERYRRSDGSIDFDRLLRDYALRRQKPSQR